MTQPRILVFAYSDLGHACLKFLLDKKENVVAVYTHEDNPGEKIWFPSVKKLAEEKNVPMFTPESLAGEIARIKGLSPELIFSFYYRNLIAKEILGLARLGAYNMHGSFLPKYRGRAPVNWAVLHGEKQTGATLHAMVEKADAGDIIDQEPVPIGPDDTAAQVQAGVTKAAVQVLARQIENLKSGKAPRRAQDQAQATYFGRRRPEDGKIDWSRPAREIHNLVRAVTRPYPGAFAEIEGKKTIVWSSKVAGPSGLKSGQIKREGKRLLVGCGDGQALEILQSQIEGEKEK